MRMDQSWYERH